MNFFNLFLVIFYCVMSIHCYSCSPLPSGTKNLQEYGEMERNLADGIRTTPVDLFRAEDSSEFAVKRYKHSSPDDEEYYNNICNEYNIGRSLTHPHIVQTLDLVQSPDGWLLVLEVCSYTLADAVDSSPDGMAIDEADRTFAQLADAISFMHQEGIAHHDLKLTNVMFDSEGNAKIIDFGTAYRFIDPLTRMANRRYGPYGTIAFNAPETYAEDLYNASPVDVWALAIIYCMMLQPKLPWKRHFAPSKWHFDTFGIFELDDTYQPEDIAWIEPLSSHTMLDHHAVAKSLARLVEFLPQHSRKTILSMLELDPRSRASWAEILKSPMMEMR